MSKLSELKADRIAASQAMAALLAEVASIGEKQSEITRNAESGNWTMDRLKAERVESQQKMALLRERCRKLQEKLEKIDAMLANLAGPKLG